MFVTSEADIRHVEMTYLESKVPLVFKDWPGKEKRRYILVRMVAAEFEKGRTYTEMDVNETIKPIYHDFVSIRRYLVDYGFLSREKNGSSYWVNDNE